MKTEGAAVTLTESECATIATVLREQVREYELLLDMMRDVEFPMSAATIRAKIAQASALAHVLENAEGLTATIKVTS